MKLDIIQTSFSAGEFGPQLFGRTDIAQYANACEIVQNFLPRPYGPAISMPGTRYVATVSDSTLRTRLIKFVFNRSDAYAIEMGDRYLRFFTNRGQVVTPGGSEDLSAFTANLIAHWKCNDNVGGTGTTTVLDAVGSYNGTATTVTSSLSTTAIVSTGFNLQGVHRISVSDQDAFTRTASTQPMTILGWFYYTNNGSSQCFVSKSGEYELSVDSSNQLSFIAYSGTADAKLLLHSDGADASTTFTDSSDSAHTVTAVGNAQLDTAQFKFGTASGLFDGTGDYLTVPDSADWDFGTADFTIDFWVRFSVVGSAGFIDRNSTTDFTVNYNGANLVFQIGSSAVVTQAWSPSADTWYHIAAVRSGTDCLLFVDGTQLGSTGTNSTNINSAEALNIGRVSNNTGLFNGWMDEIRIVKGSAVWTSNFSVAVNPYELETSNSWKVNNSISSGWNFVAVTFAGTGASEPDCTIYVNGELSEHAFTAESGFVKMANTTSLFRIGTTSAAGAKNWNSKIDNIAFIHQLLTSAQIAALYSTSVYQLSTVFTENEVFDVHYAQLNDVIWLAHPNHPPQKLIRTSANEWTIADHAFIGGPFLDSNTNTSTTLSVSATQGTINITAATGKTVFTRSGSTLGHHNAYWAIGGLCGDTDVTTGLKIAGYAKITHVINSYTATATVIKNLKDTTTTSNWSEGAWSAVRGYPARVILQGNRLWYARTNHEPQKEWGSRIFLYDDFALDTQADDDGLNLALSSNESNEIQFLAAGKSILAGTFGGVFITNSGSTEALTPDNVTASEEIGSGSEDIMPKKLGNFLYYVQRFGKKLRELFYNWELDSYKSLDKTILAPHILGDGVVDMDVQNNPESVFYCVLTSGTLATMSREIDQDVTAWARHTTSGTYTSIAVIPSQSANYDEAWVIVERWINGNPRKYVEFFENIDVPTRQDKCLYLHSALTYDAYESTTSSNVTISLSASSGSVTLTSSTAYFNGGMINKRLRAINVVSGATIGEGTITATASTTSITLSITTTFNVLSYAAGLWGVSVSTISGLSHLEAKTIGILADGNTESLTRTVASGAVTLGSNYFVISAGLSYDQVLFTLAKEAATERGTAQGKWQRYSEVAFKINRSTQNFKYGPDADNLDDVNLAITPTVTTLYTGILPPQGGAISMRGGYKRGAQVYIKNSQPLPLEILNIIGSLDTYEK